MYIHIKKNPSQPIWDDKAGDCIESDFIKRVTLYICSWCGKDTPVYGTNNNNREPFVRYLLHNEDSFHSIINISIDPDNTTVKLYIDSTTEKLYIDSITIKLYIDSTTEKLYIDRITVKLYIDSTTVKLYIDSITVTLYIDSITVKLYIDTTTVMV